MTRGLWILLTVLAQVAPAQVPPKETSDPIVPMRVLLEKGTAERSISSDGRGLYGRHGTPPKWERLQEPSTVRAGGIGLEVDGKAVRGESVYVRGGAAPDASVHFEGKKFPGAMRFTRDGKSLLVTNVVPLETYLAGTVGAEMPGNWPLEALKAQAVASRSYALFMHEHPRDPRYDLERTVLDQVYDGNAKTERVRTAVTDTKTEILVYDDGVVKAYYHSRCGGSTDIPKNVWGKSESGPFASVPCAFCKKSKYRWSAFLPSDEVSRVLSLRPVDPSSLSPLGFFDSGRLRGLRSLAGNEWSGETLRKLFGYGKLKSTRFRWEPSDAGWFVAGLGAGHGVGMCQWGARSMALAGNTYREILAHFYPGARIVTLRTEDRRVSRR